VNGGEPREKTARPQDEMLSDVAFSELSRLFEQLADKSRLKILLSLARAGEMHVSALCACLAQSQPAVSHHLRMLRLNRLVDYRRDGKFNFYRLDGEAVGHFLSGLFGVTDGGKQRIKLGPMTLTVQGKSAPATRVGDKKTAAG
jgi:ArsR family transcriptional regulator, arsenate/arsenite/antimonite-responsive transcriptional repressor